MSFLFHLRSSVPRRAVNLVFVDPLTLLFKVIRISTPPPPCGNDFREPTFQFLFMFVQTPTYNFYEPNTLFFI